MQNREVENWTLTRRPPPAPPSLTAEQQRAAAPSPGVRVVLGGPGTGKSTTLVEAVASRVAAGSSLERIAVLTTSRPEAQEVRRQLARRVSRAQAWPRVTTVHGFALGVLRELAAADLDFRLLRAPEQERSIRDLLAGRGEEFWPEGVRAAVPTREFARQLRDVLARARQLSLDPELMARHAREQGDELFGRAAEFFEEYLTVSDMSGSLDYGELVHRTRLLLVDEDVAAALRSRFDAVVVDDAQELDAAQAELVADLARTGLPLLAFADPQQRIGGYRGATSLAVPTLQGLPGAETLLLTRGFRNGQAVAGALGTIRQRLSSVAAPPPPDPVAGLGGRVTATIYDDEAAEAAHVAQALREAVLKDGLAWSDLAVVVRAGRAQLPSLARDLTRYGVPVEVAGDDLPLGRQQAVQVLLLALQVAAGGAPDADQANRLFTSPLARLDSVALRQLGRELLARHRDAGNSVQLLGRCLADTSLLAGIELPAAAAVRHLGDLLTSARDGLSAGGSVPEALWLLWDGTGWPQELRTAALAGSRRAHLDLDAVVELFEQAARRDDLVGPGGAATFITEVEGEEIPADTGREVDLVGRGVRLLTAHRSRSGEWRRVWLVGVQEGRWPRLAQRARLLDPDRLAPDHLDAASPQVVLGDERRLLYAAAARTAEELHVSAAQGVEGENGRASRFLAELGVPVTRVTGIPAARLSAPSLIAELRHVAGDATRTEGIRRAAALRLAQLAEVVDGDGHQPFRAADPGTWWGLRQASSDAPPAPGVVTLNGSGLGQLLDCPRMWFLARRARAEAGRQSRASVGDLVHAIAQRAETDGLTAEEAAAELDAVWDRVPFEAEWLSATERVQVGAALERFYQWRQTQAGELLGVELEFDVPVEVDGTRVRLTGKVDRLERDALGRLKVVDLKTGRKRQPREIEDDAQLGVYQLAVSLGAFDAVSGGTRAVAPPSLLFLRDGDALPTEMAQKSIDDSPGLDGEDRHGPTWVHDRLATAVGTIRSGRFEARECGACRYCPFADSCPALHHNPEELGA